MQSFNLYNILSGLSTLYHGIPYSLNGILAALCKVFGYRHFFTEAIEPSQENATNLIPKLQSISTTNQPSERNLLSIGIFAKVHLLDGKIVRKVSRSKAYEDKLPIYRESEIYRLLGDHPRIAQYLSSTENSVDIQYYKNGTLTDYLQKHPSSISLPLRSKWFRQIIEAVVKVHEHGVIHSDLALRQFFLDDEMEVRLGDFNSSQCPGKMALGYEKASHCLPRDYEAPNTIESGLFALGSTLYELMTGTAPYSELRPIESEATLKSNDPAVIRGRIEREETADREIEALFARQVFPDVSGLHGGDIILGCWRGQISSARDLLEQYGRSVNAIGIF